MSRFILGLSSITLPTFSLVDSGGSNNSATGSFSFTGADFGAADNARLLVFAMTYAYGSGTPSPSSLSIGGVSALGMVSCLGNASGVMFGWAHVPTGTSGNIDVGFSASTIVRKAWALVRLTDLNSFTPVDTDNPAGASETSRSVSLDVAAGGIALAAAYSGLTPPASWTNATSLVDIVTGNPPEHLAVGYANPSTAQTGLSISHSARVICSVSFR